VKKRMIIACRRLASALELSLQVDKSQYSVVIVEAEKPLTRVLDDSTSPDAAIVELTGRENAAELAGLLDGHAQTRFVFLASEFPPHAAIARIVRRNGSTILRREDEPIFVVANLIALLAGRPDVVA
jgi:hypothetical protein